MKVKITYGRPFVSLIYVYDLETRDGKFIDHAFVETEEELRKRIQQKKAHQVTKIATWLSFSKTSEGME